MTDWSEFITPIALAVVPVLGALGGVALGHWTSKRQEQAQWMRDAKHRTYVELIRQGSDILQAVRDIGETQSVEAWKRYLDALETFRMATSEMQLVGSERVWRRVIEFNSVTNAINLEWTSDPSKWPSRETAEQHEGWEPWDTLKERMFALFDELRRDMGLEPVPEFERTPVKWGTD